MAFIVTGLHWAFAALLTAIGAYLLVRGIDLAMLGGSWYYLIAGLALLAAVVFLLRRSPWGARLYALITAATVGWSLVEANLDFIALLPRLAAWLVVGVWFLMPWYRAAIRRGDRTRTAGGWWVAGAILAGVAVLITGAMQRYTVTDGTRTAVTGPPTVTDWRHYGNSPGGTRFAQLDRITPENVGTLQEVWRIRTGIPYEFKNTPLQVGDLLYLCTAGNTVIALDATTGNERWRHNPQNTVTGGTVADLADDNMFSRSCRGLGYYDAPAESPTQCPSRIITATTDARLIALNARTGEPCGDFGTNGETDLRAGLGPHHPLAYMHTSVPLIAGTKVVIGGWVVDNQQLGNVSGVVRAYDVMTGAFAWAWDMGRPDDRGLPPEGERFTPGTPNVWSIMSYDPDLDLIYAPTGNASPDYFGAKRRAFDEAYASSIIALRGATGELVWSFQTVHHDIWDYDVPSQPTLINITKDGQRIPAVAQPTKRGEIFLLDRRDGTPIYPATTCPDGTPALAGGECPTPQDPIEGDTVAPTQPFSALPHFRPRRHERDMWGLTPLDQLYCRIEFRKMRYEGQFTPPMRGGGALGQDTTWGGTFQYPGNGGGFNWPSVSVDADNGLLVAQPMMVGNRVIMVTGEEARAAYEARAGRDNRDEPGPASDHGAPDPDQSDDAQTDEPERARPARLSDLLQGDPTYTDQGSWDPELSRYALTSFFVSGWKIPLLGVPTNMPCFEPPYGRLAVIDLNTNTLLWSRAIGNIKQNGSFEIIPGIESEFGLPIYGGTMTTRGGLIFQTGTLDSGFRALDLRTGETLWSTRLPASAQSTPITYDANGRQFVAVAVPHYPQQDQADSEGGWVIAYALPEPQDETR